MIRRRVLVPALALAPAAQARPAQVGFLHPRLAAPVEPLRLAAARERLTEAARSYRLRTARAPGLDPPPLLARADEVVG